MTYLRKISSCSLAVILCCVACNSAPVDVEPDAATVIAPVVKKSVTPPPRTEVFRSLTESFQNAYVGRRGVVLGPGLPGWDKISQLTGQAAWHRPSKIDGREGAWFDGIGATVGFPVGPEGPSLRTLSIWLYPVGPRQATSVFLDGAAIATIQLKTGWHRYDFPLPASGLGEGEHRLRFWFRYSANRRRMKTPAALGMVELRAADEGAHPTNWFLQRDDAVSLPYAGPPSRWSLGILVPKGGKLSARGQVDGGGPVDFIIRVEEDRVGRVEVARVKVTRGRAVAFEASLARWEGKIIRLSFGTDGMPDALERAHWRDIKLSALMKAPAAVSSVKNLVVWSVEGMWSSDPGLDRKGTRAATPNLDLLYEAGAAALHTWSGGSGRREAHSRMLGHEGPVPLAEQLSNLGWTTGVFSSNPRFSVSLRDGFQTRSVAQSREARFSPEATLGAFNDWVYAHGKSQFFAYLDATAIGAASRKAEEAAVSFGGGTNVAHERLAQNDYWLGQMLGILERHNALATTAIIVTGMPSRSLKVAPAVPHQPQRLYTPLVLWHPNYAMDAESKRDLRGADLHDLASAVRTLLGVSTTRGQNEKSLASALLHHSEFWPTPSIARTPHGWVVGYGDWVYWPRAKPKERLWRASSEGNNLVAIDGYPIAVRVLRDQIASITAARPQN